MQLESNELEMRIRQLCARLMSLEDGPELTATLYELRKAIRAHTEAVRKVAYATVKGTLSEAPDTTSKAAD